MLVLLLFPSRFVAFCAEANDVAAASDAATNPAVRRAAIMNFLFPIRLDITAL